MEEVNKVVVRDARAHNAALKTAKHEADKVLSNYSELGETEKRQIRDTAIGITEVIDREALTLGLVGKPDLEALVRTVTESLAARKKQQVFAPSCPDYQHDGRMYTFGELGSDVSLLGMCQIEFAEKFLPKLGLYGIPYDYVVLTADFEVNDKAMLKINGVTREAAMQRVKGTIEATGNYLRGLLELQNGSVVRSAGFMEEFPDFMERQGLYEAHIARLVETDRHFRRFVEEIHEGRNNLYNRLFPEAVLKGLMPRTVRTMAQYSALGDIARARNAMITSHRTLNIPAYNNQKLSLEAENGAFCRVPVLNFDRRIY